MAKKNKGSGRRAGHRAGAGDQRWEFPPWQWCAALLPYRIGTKKVEAGAGFPGGDLGAKVEFGKPVPITSAAGAAKQKRTYESWLELDWIAPEIRYAVLNALGRKQSYENQQYELGRTLAWRRMVDETVARMKKNGARPVNGFRTAAIAEVAEGAGIEPKTLQQRFDRLPKKAS
jgi:hypothetical protein